MNEWFKIGGFLLLLLLLTAEDCSNRVSEPSREEQVSELYLDIENNFEKERLETEELEVYEIRSLQMLSDLIDYVNICADSSLTKEFRLESRQMINNFFLTGEDADKFFTKLNIIEDKNNEVLMLKGKDSFQLKLDSSQCTKSFSQQTDLTYSGEIKFDLSSNYSDLNFLENKIVVRLKKSEKQFGEKTMDIWGVFFGNIN